MKHARGSFNLSFLNYTIDEMIYEFMQDNQIDGLSMAIVQAPYITRAVGYGIANLKYGTEQLVSINTIFALAEISLGFLDVALIQAHEQGLLNINDHVSKWLPTLKDEYKEYKLLDLMLHKTKITDFRQHPNYDKQHKYQPQEILNMINELKEHDHIADSLYLSPSNAYLLTLIIEKASKLTYTNFVRKYQIDFLNLKNTYFSNELNKILKDENLEQTKKHALFQTQKEFINPTEIAISYINNDVHEPNLNFDLNLKGYSDLYANAIDVSFWDIALAGTSLIQDKNLAKLIYEGTQINNTYVNASAGWEQTYTKGFLDIYGTNGGYSAYLSRFTAPDDLVCVTLLINKPNIDLTQLARNIAGAYKTDLALEYDYHDLYLIESCKDANQTYNDLLDLLKDNNIKIFAEIDHSQAAQDVNLDLAFNKVVVFGNPKIGTQLMLDEPSIGLELPLKIQVFTDEKKHVWVATNNLETYYEKYNNQELIKLININNNVKTLVNQAARIYKK